MDYIGTAVDGHQGVYLDMHNIDRSQDGLRVSAMIGDGCYEGEVLIECGELNQVTFADAWLGGDGLAEFLQRCGQRWLETALLEAVRHTLTTESREAGTCRPHASRRERSAAGYWAESQPVWHATA